MHPIRIPIRRSYESADFQALPVSRLSRCTIDLISYFDQESSLDFRYIVTRLLFLTEFYVESQHFENS